MLTQVPGSGRRAVGCRFQKFDELAQQTGIVLVPTRRHQQPIDDHRFIGENRAGLLGVERALGNRGDALSAKAIRRRQDFNSMAQTGAEFFERFRALGARRFRLEFLNETPDEVERTLAQYRKLFRSEIAGSQLWRELKLVNQLGVTRGQMAGTRS